jgi:UDPglucose 6-dehydrogenase
MKVAIAGYGYVGKAHEAILSNYYDIEIVDTGLDEYRNIVSTDVDAVIICVATPSRSDGSCEMRHVYDVIETCPDVPILIKSTISVDGWRMIAETFPQTSLTYSPEFLRADSWMEDALAIDHIYLGGRATGFWTDMFLNALGKISVTVNKPTSLVAAKALRNNFLALKVSFFNQVEDYCKAMVIDTQETIDAITQDPRIGDSHSTISQERGFGGHCFPKDLKATVTSAHKYNTRLTLLEETLNYNESIRKKS